MRCPVCRADNNEDVACRRCRADLSLLLALEELRRRCLDAAQTCLGQRQVAPALEHIRRADEVRHGLDTDRLAAVAHLLGGNFSEAWRLYRAVRKGE